ncbi:hypothetical protein BCV70DRAFT_10140 [Testicularia cyperi]|uniref:N-acetyltransferase domain-containing protein n=1 Tax=Testicularia cyperi TaxID=1882483 RepID=A0A317Y083_9BASI|nr:hypothetical protein BCV70DRAFT_10140 [Testicularia cyperi]
MAYGHVPRPSGSKPSDLRPRVYALPERAQTAQREAILAVPFNAVGDEQEAYISSDGSNPLKPPSALVDFLAATFNDELAKGVTYPQRGPMDRAEFEGYFLGYDLIVGVFLSADQVSAITKETIPEDGLQLPSLGLVPHLASLDYSTAVAGFYYIKPNYPGRSSHLCNAGFVVPPTSRGLGLGGVLGRSYLHFGPKAGYKGSVFNLVYVNNVASVRIWQRLGFTIVGRLPMAGLLKTETGEELTDAYIIFKDFTGKLQDPQTGAAKPSEPIATDGSKTAA